MLNFGFSELALIVIAAFLLLGPKELPGVIRALSRFMRQCREVLDECRAQIDEMDADDVRETLNTEKKFIRDQFGELREVYDVSDIIRERQGKESISPPPVPHD